MKKLLLISCTLLLAGCATFNSGCCYRMGTEELECGNYAQAIIELEDAVRYDPTIAKNHTNLGIAYLKVGNCDKFWYHTRKAVLCPIKDEAGPINFFLLCQERILMPGLNEKGTPYDEIVAKLGAPDIVIASSDGSISICQYGTFVMRFENGALISSEFNLT